jgi:Zn-dependent peptidase ImmA (M78 family)
MALLRNDSLNKLQSSISDITSGQSITFWANSIAESLTTLVTKKGNAVDLYELLKLRNVFVHELNDDDPKSPFKASLVNRGSHYDLYLNSIRISSSNEKKFILAHEIAHTLFYTNKDGVFIKNTTLDFGSDEIEHICDYLAICLLLPKNSITEEISDYIADQDSMQKRNANYLNFIFALAARYQVNWHSVLYRLMMNFGFLPNSLCIEFSKKDNWYITWCSQTDSLEQRGLFIPFISKSENRFVSAKESFTIILEKVITDVSRTPRKYGHVTISKSIFDKGYRGGIKRFLTRDFTPKVDILKIYYRVDSSTNIILLFPFDGLLIT